MVKKYYSGLDSIELIQIVVSELDKLTPEAKEIVSNELKQRGISIDEIDSIEKLSDLHFFKFLIENKFNQKNEINRWVEFRRAQRLRPYVDDISSETIETNLRKLWRIRVQIIEEEVSSDQSGISFSTHFYAMQLYLREKVLNNTQRELYELILTLNVEQLKALNLDDVSKQIAQKEIVDVISKLNRAGRSFTQIGNYLVRYIVGSIAFSLIFTLQLFLGKPTVLTYLFPIFYAIMTLMLLGFIIGEFFSAGEKLEEIKKSDFENLGG